MVSKLKAMIRQFWCHIWGGHDHLLTFDDGVRLTCQSCGHESPGWRCEPRYRYTHGKPNIKEAA